jgi:hypothetical protein
MLKASTSVDSMFLEKLGTESGYLNADGGILALNRCHCPEADLRRVACAAALLDARDGGQGRRGCLTVSRRSNMRTKDGPLQSLQIAGKYIAPVTAWSEK